MNIRIHRPAGDRDFSGAMTDISFLLIIFFLVTAVFMSTQGILVRLPDVDTSPRTLKPDEVVQVSITSPGAYRVGDREAGFSELKTLMSARIAILKEPILILNVSADVRYEEVLSVLEIAKEAGASSFSIKYRESDPRGLKISGDSP